MKRQAIIGTTEPTNNIYSNNQPNTLKKATSREAREHKKRPANKVTLCMPV